MAQIGLKNLYGAMITEDASGNETYGSPFRIAKAISADLSVNTDDQTLWADDGADVNIKDFINGTLTLNVNDLDNTVKATLLGATADANGVVLSAGENVPPSFAIGFQSRSAKGGDRYFWFYRVQFAVPNETINTKGESITFGTPTIVGTISRRNKAESNGTHLWKAEVKAGEAGVSATVITNWFSAVYIPGTTSDAVLTALTIASATLSPTFDSAVTEYTATTTAASGAVTATTTADKVIIVNGNSIASGGTATWETGPNDVTITVNNGTAQRTYHVVVTKS